MFLRPYHPDDLEELLTLFYETVHTVNAADYTPRQLDAWAPAAPDRGRWQRTLAAHTALVAVEEGRIVGFGDIDATGYLDHLFVRWDCQGRGVATAICDALEEHCRALGLAAVTVHASKTALPFFLHRGYRVEREQQVPVRGQVLTNYAMNKTL